MYVNVGAKHYSSGHDIATKSGLKKMIQENPDKVLLYTTSLFGNQFTKKATELDTGVKYSVVGPNPYNNRKWYATVEKRTDGKVTVK